MAVKGVVRLRITKRFRYILAAEHCFAVNLNGANLPELGTVE